MDLTVKGLPDDINITEIKEIMARLVENHETMSLNKVPAVATATQVARTKIDVFRKSNGLAEKFKAAVNEEPVNPK